VSELFGVLVFVAVVGAIAAGVIVIQRGRHRTADAPPAGDVFPDTNPDGSGRFHALSIRSGRNACAAAREIHGQRFLAKEAPELPLAGCDRRHCYCRTVHHRDRRSGDDRRQPFQSGFGGSATRIGEDRRRSADRRGGGGSGADQ